MCFTLVVRQGKIPFILKMQAAHRSEPLVPF